MGIKLAIGVAVAAMVGIVGIGTRGLADAPMRAPAPAVRHAPPVKIARPAQTPAAAPAVAQKAAAGTFVLKRVLDVPNPYRHGDWVWDEAGVPAGPIVVTVDTDAEVLSIFRGGYEIGSAVVLYGADWKPTPLGVYPVTQKDRDHHSTTYGGAPMPYMLRLTDDGVSIHGSDVVQGAATHGCIGVPVAFAKKLFAAVKLGDPVIVTRGKRIAIGQDIKG